MTFKQYGRYVLLVTLATAIGGETVGDDLNVINPGFKGVIPVAVLSSDLVCHVETESLSLDWDIGEVCLT